MPNGDEGQEEQGQEDILETPEEEPQGQGQDMIPRDQLPEELRDLPPEQIGSATQALVSTLQSRNQEVQELRQALTSRGTESRPQGREPQPQEPEVEDLSDEEFKDLILEDPEQALEHYLKKKGYAQKLQQIEQMAEQGAHGAAFTRARQELNSFGQYEDQVQEILENTGSPPSYTNIRGAYFMARGMADYQTSEQEKAQAVTSEQPSPPEPSEEEPELTEGERRAMEAFGLSKEDFIRGRDQRVEVTPPGIEE